MENSYEIKTVDAANVDKLGFFCYMSKRKEPGYIQKRAWLEQCFAEGMKIKILHENGGRDVGFIEYIPGEYAWRAVHAPGYLVIHCLWVVGKGKRKGYGTRLIQACLDDARSQGKHGVVMVSSDGVWLAHKKIFLYNGFEQVDQAAPSFQLLVHRFGSAPAPALPQDWEERLERFGAGVTVVRTSQCPYIENIAALTRRTAQEMQIPVREVVLQSAAQVQEESPTPYGVFAIVQDGRLVSYHYLDQDTLVKRFHKTTQENEHAKA